MPARQAVPPAAALRDRRLLGRPGLRGRRDAAPDARRRGGGDGRAFPAHPQRPGRHVPGRRGRLSRRHRRDRHGPQHGRDPCRLRRAVQVRRQPRRRLTPAEMAQIAGRAGRHQRDGTFGTLTIEGEAMAEFRPRRSRRSRSIASRRSSILYWRDGDPDYRSVEALIRSLERAPTEAGLRAAPEAVDLAVLKRLAERSGGPRARARRAGGAPALGGLRAARFPQDRRRLPRPAGRAHLRLHLTEGDGRIPQGWYAEQSRGSTMCRATSTRWPTGSRACAPGPISPTAPTGCTTPPRWPSAPARSRRSCRTRSTSG
jgi:hypothetical protein